MTNGRPLRPERVIHRRLRKTQYIVLPELTRAPVVPQSRHHAQKFAFAFLLMVAIGGGLLATPFTTEDNSTTPVIDAVFTAFSAASVTGLITVDTQDHWNFLGELVILVLIQAGGLGFMVGASLVLQTLRRGQTRLSDSLLMRDGQPTVSLREATTLSKRIVWFIFVTEAIGAAILTLRFWGDMPFHEALWFGVFHSISAFCNAGFDLQGGFASLIGYNDSYWVGGTLMLLIQLGALSFLALEDVATKRNWSRLYLDTKLVLIANAVLVVGGALFFALAEWNRALVDLPGALRPFGALFQSVAARTAGFATVNVGDFRAATLFVWVGIMMVGGASGSTAGGIKLSTIGVVIAAVVSTLRGREEVLVFSRRITTPLIFRAIAVIVLFIVAHFSITLLLVLSEDYAADRHFGFLELMFETMSGLATVGLTTGITPDLSSIGKAILCLAMFLGRLGPLTAAYALQRHQRPVRYSYPIAPIRIG